MTHTQHHDTTRHRLITARTAHIMLGHGILTRSVTIGLDPGTARLKAIYTEPTSNDRRFMDDCTMALCQWDDSRGFFLLDSTGNVYDGNTLMDHQGKHDIMPSWKDAVHRVMIPCMMEQSSILESKVYENFTILSRTAGMDNAMCYLACVAYDVDEANDSEQSTPLPVLVMGIMDSYRLVDPYSRGLDIIEACTVKAFGEPRFYDLDFSKLPGRWTYWERDLKKLNLPSNMWLVLRRATGLLGKVDRNIVVPVVRMFIPSRGMDLTDMIMNMMPSNQVDAWLRVFRSWVQPDSLEYWADGTRYEWALEYVDITRRVLEASRASDNPWNDVSITPSTGTGVSATINELRESPMELQLEMLMETWGRVYDVFQSVVMDAYSMESLRDAIESSLNHDMDLNADITALTSILGGNTGNGSASTGDNAHDDGAMGDASETGQQLLDIINANTSSTESNATGTMIGDDGSKDTDPVDEPAIVDTGDSPSPSIQEGNDMGMVHRVPSPMDNSDNTPVEDANDTKDAITMDDDGEGDEHLEECNGSGYDGTGVPTSTDDASVPDELEGNDSGDAPKASKKGMNPDDDTSSRGKDGKNAGKAGEESPCPIAKPRGLNSRTASYVLHHDENDSGDTDSPVAHDDMDDDTVSSGNAMHGGDDSSKSNEMRNKTRMLSKRGTMDKSILSKEDESSDDAIIDYSDMIIELESD